MHAIQDASQVNPELHYAEISGFIDRLAFLICFFIVVSPTVY